MREGVQETEPTDLPVGSEEKTPTEAKKDDKSRLRRERPGIGDDTSHLSNTRHWKQSPESLS